MDSNKTGQSFSSASHIHLEMRAQCAYLRVARVAVAQVVNHLGMAEKVGDTIVLAVEEALTNVIRHSYDGPCEKPIIIEINTIRCDDDGEQEALEILIRDFGKQVDPETIKGRDLDEFKPGGLGVHIIKSVMDECQYTQASDTGMQLRLIKYLAPSKKDKNKPESSDCHAKE
ncbi:MAG: ATP-binding protein [Phycisphaerae bacterium]|nr:ATP-binding protein [Phycisphaerae bacterium]